MDFVFVYLYDLLVTSPDHKTHKKHLKILFKRLTEYGIIIGPDKWQFGTSFLEHYVCPVVKPERQRALRRYLGMVNYFHRFIPHCAEKLTPLNRLSPKSNFELHWTENANVAFTEPKQILANATLLVHPQQSAPLNITCDASDFAVGGVLQQCIDNVWQTLSFFTKKLLPAETRYSTFDRELLAVDSTIRHFRHNLKGREFYVNTDHKPLTYVMNSTTERPSLRQTRHLAFIVHNRYSICEGRNEFRSGPIIATNSFSY